MSGSWFVKMPTQRLGTRIHRGMEVWCDWLRFPSTFETTSRRQWSIPTNQVWQRTKELKPLNSANWWHTSSSPVDFEEIQHDIIIPRSCRLNFVAINGDGTTKFLGDLGENYKSEVYSVNCLVNSKQEERCEANEKFELEDRNWNWKDPEFKYFSTQVNLIEILSKFHRSSRQPGYIGSYAMDAMSMALHCLWTTKSLKEAMLKSANIRGDSDTVTSICGQMAGAIYGCSEIPAKWMEIVGTWDPHGFIPLRAYKLFHHSAAKAASPNKKRKSQEREWCWQMCILLSKKD